MAKLSRRKAHDPFQIQDTNLSGSLMLTSSCALFHGCLFPIFSLSPRWLFHSFSSQPPAPPLLYSHLSHKPKAIRGAPQISHCISAGPPSCALPPHPCCGKAVFAPVSNASPSAELPGCVSCLLRTHTNDSPFSLSIVNFTSFLGHSPQPEKVLLCLPS